MFHSVCNGLCGCLTFSYIFHSCNAFHHGDIKILLWGVGQLRFIPTLSLHLCSGDYGCSENRSISEDDK